MKNIGRFALASLFLNTAVIAAPFEGEYKCEGEDPYLNKHYTGTVIISQQNTVYKLDMRYDTGEKAHGTGGQYNEELLSVVFQDTKDKEKIGLEQYHWLNEEKTKMGGYWVYLNKDKLGTEICEKIK